MDISPSNQVRLCGSMAGRPVYSHSSRDRQFYLFPLEVERLSGAVDRINIVVGREQLELLEPAEEEKLLVEGELRTFNDRHGAGAKLVITVLGRRLSFCREPDQNLVELTGALCKPPNLRTTPMGRDICDLMLAVNRPYGRSDYLPCICWGLKAMEASAWAVGDRVSLKGRIQSRQYIKLTDQGPVEKTAFEVSATQIGLWAPEEKAALGEGIL